MLRQLDLSQLVFFGWFVHLVPLKANRVSGFLEKYPFVLTGCLFQFGLLLVSSISYVGF